MQSYHLPTRSLSKQIRKAKLDIMKKKTKWSSTSGVIVQRRSSTHQHKSFPIFWTRMWKSGWTQQSPSTNTKLIHWSWRTIIKSMMLTLWSCIGMVTPPKNLSIFSKLMNWIMLGCTSWNKISLKLKNTSSSKSTTNKSIFPLIISMKCQILKTSSRRRKIRASIIKSITLYWVRINLFKLHIALSHLMPTFLKDWARRRISPKSSKTLTLTWKLDYFLMKSWLSPWLAQLLADLHWIMAKWKISSTKK